MLLEAVLKKQEISSKPRKEERIFKKWIDSRKSGCWMIICRDNIQVNTCPRGQIIYILNWLSKVNSTKEQFLGHLKTYQSKWIKEFFYKWYVIMWRSTAKYQNEYNLWSFKMNPIHNHIPPCRNIILQSY